MKQIYNLCAIIGLAILLSFAGCASFNGNEVLPEVGIKYATMKVIEVGDTTEKQSVRATVIYNFANEAKSFWDTDSADLPNLENLINTKLAALDLQPSDRMLAQVLVSTVIDELKRRVDIGAVSPDYKYQVSTVLGWVAEVSKVYMK